MLDEHLVEAIIFALENQYFDYYLDLRKYVLVSEEEIDFEEISEGESSFCLLPDWGPAQGYQLMKDFAQGLKQKEMKDKLLNILASGRGVFRGFKDSLADNDKLWSDWLSFKKEQMQNYILKWYNGIRKEMQIDQVSPLDYDPELNAENFSVQEFEDENKILHFEESKGFFSESNIKASSQGLFWNMIEDSLRNFSKIERKMVVCYTAAREAAGFCEYFIQKGSREKAAIINALLVFPGYQELFLDEYIVNETFKILQKKQVDAVYLKANLFPSETENKSIFKKLEVYSVDIKKLF